ncbi:MAG: glycosyltransferase [Actinobacteria bacterium]|nr:glycosyltransferase [Actinomycetota bacterium]
MLCIGSFEPRKNQLAVIHACEQLWREGIEVELRLIGGGGWKRDVARAVGRLQAAGRPVSVHTAISEEELAANYASARFTVFVSQHEGYGLPVAESLAYGVPAITTNYGSTAEIAAGGGVLTVDPRNDQEILDTMRRLLTDDHELDRLIAEIGRRPDRRWSEYAAELWQQLVAPDQVAAPTAVLAGAAE